MPAIPLFFPQAIVLLLQCSSLTLTVLVIQRWRLPVAVVTFVAAITRPSRMLAEAVGFAPPLGMT